jgi:hypothetical protein
MTLNGKMQKVMMRVLAVMLLASFLLAALSVVARAWWYEECRSHHTYVDACQPFACGWTKYWRREYHTWKCHDGSGYCYDTGSVCDDRFAGVSTCNPSSSNCP